MKKLLSTTSGRIGALLALVLIIVAGKSVIDRIVPIQIFNAVKSGSLKYGSNGAIILPWYWAFDSASGYAYVTVINKHTYVVMPQEIGAETRFTGELATDDNIDMSNPGTANGLPSLSLNSPGDTSTPADGAAETITINGKIAANLYAVSNNAG